MTRRGSPEEQRWRDKRNRDPNFGGTVHGEQPVDPRGRLPREKPSGHRHRDPQPPKDHGAKHDAGGADENPHTTTTTNPHSVTHSQVGAPSGNPHGVTASEAGAVANAVGAPSKRRDTRANQPAASNVAVGSEYRVKDEAEVLEVATDTDGDGTADTWAKGSTRGVVPTQYVTAADSRDRNIDNSDWQADGTSDQVTIQNAVDALPVGTK